MSIENVIVKLILVILVVSVIVCRAPRKVATLLTARR